MSKRVSGTEIVGKLRQADVLIAQGTTLPEVCRELGVSHQTYYRWRNKYGELPCDLLLLGTMVENICFNNAVEYFNIQ